MKITNEREIETKMRKRDVLDVKSRKNVIMDLLLCTMATMCLTSCSKRVDKGERTITETKTSEVTTNSNGGGDDKKIIPLMFDYNNGKLHELDDKYGTCYEVFLRSFCDGNGDGIGDINGLISKLDYINDGNSETDGDLGADEIWLMPIHPSPSYHKYDVMDYTDIDSAYGSLEDFDNLIKECDKRGIKVILDMVFNHTSSKHPWFKEAYEEISSLKEGEKIQKDNCSKYISYYNITDEIKGTGYKKIGNSDYYYECQFSDNMPDLNLANDEVRKELEKVMKFWLDKGVSGFRLDATTYYMSGDLDGNIDVLTWLNNYVKSVKEDAYIVGEAWTNEPTYSAMYKSRVDSFFNFEFAEKGGVISSILNGSKDASYFGEMVCKFNDDFEGNNENFVDAPFLSNHDTGRVAGYFAGDEADEKIKIAWAMNMLQGGRAFLYYGEELGMKGSGADENKRVHMYWSDGEYAGMTGDPEGSTFKMKYESYEKQKDDPYSIYNFMKQAIKLRNIFPQIARGKNELVEELSDKNICVLKKGGLESFKEFEDGAKALTDEQKNEYAKELYIVINTYEEETEVDISKCGFILKDNKVTDEEAREWIVGILQTNEEYPNMKDGKLIMPAYSIAILSE